MSDPFSILAGVIGIASAGVKSAKVLFQLVDDVKEGPEEIRTVSRDAHAFCTIVISLSSTLKENKSRDVICADKAMVAMLENLLHPLTNCESVLQALYNVLQKHIKPRGGGKESRISALNMRWALSTKSRVKSLQLRLEATKSTLDTALDAISMLCSMRLVSMGKLDAAQSVSAARKPDTSLALRRYVEESVCDEAETQASRQLGNDSHEVKQPPVRSPERDHQPLTPNEQSVPDPELQHYLIKIYNEVKQNRLEIAEVKIAIDHRNQKKRLRGAAASQPGSRMHEYGLIDRRKLVNDEDDADLESSAFETEYFDCLSSFSDTQSDLSVDGFQLVRSASPNYYFERNDSFFPELYTMDGLYSDPLFVFAMVQAKDNTLTQRYFLMYAETPRCWRRLIVSTSLLSDEEQAAKRVEAPDNFDTSCKLLPTWLQKQLMTMIPRFQLFNSVTSMHLTLTEDGESIVDSPSTAPVEDFEELELSHEEQILQFIEDLDCSQYLESEVIVKSRISSSYYMALVECRPCVERKVPFAKAGTQSDNGFYDWYNDLKQMNSLRGCSGVAEFIGVVLDDTRLHLKSYLYEHPTFGNIQTIFENAQRKSETVPWATRELWCRQIIKAVSEVHKRGFVIGGTFLPVTIGIREDGVAILTDFRTSQRHVPNSRGLLAPELRSDSRMSTKNPEKVMTFRTDIFQLGRILWMVSEHKANVFGYFCAVSGCTTHPRYSCTADHTNPVELPPCRPGIPRYINDIIRACRAWDPKDRPTAHQILKALPALKSNTAPTSTPTTTSTSNTTTPSASKEALATLKRYVGIQHFEVYCLECGALTTDQHYHCNVCKMTEFSICTGCWANGIRCSDERHRLIRRVFKGGSIVEDVDSKARG